MSGAGFASYCRIRLACLLVFLPVVTLAQPQLRQMAGIPLPSTDVAVGTVTVRVVREALTNNLPDVDVQLLDGSQTRTERTDADGRAQFTGIAAGAQVRVQTTVDGETVTSQSFAMPATSGVRLVLALGVGAGSGEVGGASSAGGAAISPARPGQLTLGDESRIVVEVTEGSVEVYCLLEVSNASTTPADPGAPLVFSVPAEAQGLTLLQGSIPGMASGSTVSVPGPIAAGSSLLEFAYRLPFESSRLTLTHVMPVALTQAAVVVRKIGNIDLASPLIQQRRDVPMENRLYLLATGAGVAAGEPFTVEINGLPAHAQWPRVVALGLAALVVLAGVGLEVVGGRNSARLEQELSSKREQLLGSLVQLEKQRRAGKVTPAGYASRREALVKRLEHVYADLDDLGALGRPGAGPESLAPAR